MFECHSLSSQRLASKKRSFAHLLGGELRIALARGLFSASVSRPGRAKLLELQARS